MNSALLEPFAVEIVPLTAEKNGGYLIRGTRVPLDTVIGAYLDGATPEDIVRSYDTLALADVYAVVSYYWRNENLVHEYLAARQSEAKQIRRQNEMHVPDNAAWLRLQGIKRGRVAAKP